MPQTKTPSPIFRLGALYLLTFRRRARRFGGCILWSRPAFARVVSVCPTRPMRRFWRSLCPICHLLHRRRECGPRLHFMARAATRADSAFVSRRRGELRGVLLPGLNGSWTGEAAFGRALNGARFGRLGRFCYGFARAPESDLLGLALPMRGKPASLARNLAKTGAQSVVMWLLFLGVLPFLPSGIWNRWMLRHRLAAPTLRAVADCGADSCSLLADGQSRGRARGIW